MKREAVSFLAHNLTWLLVTDVKNSCAANVDRYVANPSEMNDLLMSIKQLTTGAGKEVLFCSPQKFLTLKDYILSKFDVAMLTQIERRLSSISDFEAFSDYSATSGLILGADTDPDLDFASPSPLSLEVRKASEIEFFVLPMKIVAPATNDHLEVVLQEISANDSYLRNLVSIFRSSQVFNELFRITDGTLAITPIVANETISLRKFISQMRKMQGSKNGRLY